MAQILYLDPYHGGSHQAFVEGWQAASRHHFEVLTLPAYKWKWRMRHAAITFARQLSRRSATAGPPDLLFCTDMMNLAEFRGLCPAGTARLPSVVYFHENQLTYPSRHTDERDLHFAFTNMVTALCARRVWFNSAFHRSEFLGSLQTLLRRMPDNRSMDVVSEIRDKSDVHPPGVSQVGQRGRRRAGPLRIVWVSRWEYDKDPQTFFAALRRFRASGHPFRLNVLGEAFHQRPDCFRDAEQEFRGEIEHWGYLAQRDDYLRVLAECDVVVSTARHEFFGIAILEAVAAGCFPLVPRRLAYPEVLGESADYFHDGTADGLADRLAQFSKRLAADGCVAADPDALSSLAARYCWMKTAVRMDDAVDTLICQFGRDHG